LQEEADMTRATFTIAILSVWLVALSAHAENGNPARGQRLFRLCAPCHSLQPDRNMTGPSLSGLWNRKAGSLPSFRRYSEAFRSSGIVWNDQTLDDWIENPRHLVPGTTMTFPGVKNAQQRADLLAFLKDATKVGQSAQHDAQKGGMMGGMMGGGAAPNLKKLSPERSVKAISYCKDTYRVTTADGKTHQFWERNLRLKTDSSEEGPQKDAPALVPAGMMGDRADIIFADPGEISAHIREKC
jgi:cytochrome c